MSLADLESGEFCFNEILLIYRAHGYVSWRHTFLGLDFSESEAESPIEISRLKKT